jgi:predicted dehydrogenase
MSRRTLSRRTFLKASTSVAAATVLASGPKAKADNPSETITLGVMGVNGRGAALAKGFAGQPNARVAYVCDVDERATGRCQTSVADLQSMRPDGVTDFRKILDDKKVDCLVIAAPDHWHGPATILACTAGKHVYVEKPACHNPREGELMVAAARQNKSVVQLGTQRRSSPTLREAIERIQGGEIGRLLFARGWINSTRPNIGYGKAAAKPAWLNWELWQGPAPEREYKDNIVHYNWHWFWHWGTGELGNNGIHMLDVCRWGLGVDSPQIVTCGGGKFHFDDDQQTPDTQLATFNFGDKAIAWEHRTWNKRGFEGELSGVVFYGEKGNLVMTKDLTFYNMEGKEQSKLKMEGGEKEHLANFLACIRDRNQKLNQEIEEGVKSTLLCHLGNIAYRTGHTVHFHPDDKKIVNDPDALALWSREYRPGWEPKV